MDDIEIIEVDKNSLYLNQVEHLFAELYEYLNTAGLMVPLVAGGEKLWRKSLEKVIGGRFGILVIAVKNDNVIGFAHGVARFSPSYLGGQQVGFIPHIYLYNRLRRSITALKNRPSSGSVCVYWCTDGPGSADDHFC